MNTCATRKRLFVGVIPEAVARVHVALAAHYDLTIATSMADVAWDELSGMDLLMCNLHFDEGKLFEFLVQVKSDASTGTLPFLCINSSSALSPALLRSIETASQALGASAVVDIHGWRSMYGDEAAFCKLRNMIDELTGDSIPAPAVRHPAGLDRDSIGPLQRSFDFR